MKKFLLVLSVAVISLCALILCGKLKLDNKSEMTVYEIKGEFVDPHTGEHFDAKSYLSSNDIDELSYNRLRGYTRIIDSKTGEVITYWSK